MNNEKHQFENKKWSASQRWHFLGHSCLAVGTLCISIGHLLQLASSGEISDFAGYRPAVYLRASSMYNKFNKIFSRHINPFFKELAVLLGRPLKSTGTDLIIQCDSAAGSKLIQNKNKVIKLINLILLEQRVAS